ncbi:MAG: cupin domain-containing protein [Ignavibacteriaceae bacterium]|nr:cupin domain-containing protein [Ignavibacteriaceae bacterium]
MKDKIKNIFASLPEDFSLEVFETILTSGDVKLERIVSKGHSSPEGFWYDQDENEWVLLLQGRAELKYFDDDENKILKAGDYLNIPAHTKHRVEWTSPNEETIWLALFY